METHQSGLCTGAQLTPQQTDRLLGAEKLRRQTRTVQPGHDQADGKQHRIVPAGPSTAAGEAPRPDAGPGRAPQPAPPGRHPRAAGVRPAPGRETRPGTPRPGTTERGNLPRTWRQRAPATAGPRRRAALRPARLAPTPAYLPAAPAAATAAQPSLTPAAGPPPRPLLAGPPSSSAPIGRRLPRRGSKFVEIALPALAALRPGNARPGVT